MILSTVKSCGTFAVKKNVFHTQTLASVCVGFFSKYTQYVFSNLTMFDIVQVSMEMATPALVEQNNLGSRMSLLECLSFFITCDCLYSI